MVERIYSVAINFVKLVNGREVVASIQWSENKPVRIRSVGLVMTLNGTTVGGATLIRITSPAAILDSIPNNPIYVNAAASPSATDLLVGSAVPWNDVRGGGIKIENGGVLLQVIALLGNIGQALEGFLLIRVNEE